MIKTQSFAVILALVAAFLFGISTPLSKWLIADLNPFMLAGLLYLGAGIGLAPFALFKLKDKPIIQINTNRKLILGMILFGGVLGPVLLMLAIKIATASSVSLWLNLELVATAFLGHFLFKDYLNKRVWFSVVISLLAGCMLSYSGGPLGIKAGMLVFLACFCWGLDNHFTALIDNLSPIQSTVIKGLIAGSTNLIIGFTISGFNILPMLLVKTMLVGFLCYGISISLYITSAQKLGAVRSQLLFSIAPIFGVVISIIFLHENLSAVQLISGFLLMGSVWFMLREKHKHQHTHSAIEHIHLHIHDDLHHNHHDSQIEKPHSHLHKHQEDEHEHLHYPDLHHRHNH